MHPDPTISVFNAVWVAVDKEWEQLCPSQMRAFTCFRWKVDACTNRTTAYSDSAFFVL
jgi:hypothetical protein